MLLEMLTLDSLAQLGQRGGGVWRSHFIYIYGQEMLQETESSRAQVAETACLVRSLPGRRVAEGRWEASVDWGLGQARDRDISLRNAQESW